MYSTACGNGFPLGIGSGGDSAEIATLESAVEALQTTVGDNDSGLVKDVADIETTVGDNDSGLVKDVADLQTAVGNLDANVYSTTETKIGKWGADILYRIVVDVGALPNKTTKQVPHGLTNVSIKRIWGIASLSDGSSNIPLPYVGAGTGGAMYVNMSATNTNVVMVADTDRSTYSGLVVIEYTKITPPETNSKEKKGE